MRFNTTTIGAPVPAIAQFVAEHEPKPQYFSTMQDSGESVCLIDATTATITNLLITWSQLEVAGWLQIGDILTIHQNPAGGMLNLPFDPPLAIETTNGLWVQNNSFGGSYTVFVYFKETQ